MGAPIPAACVALLLAGLCSCGEKEIAMNGPDPMVETREYFLRVLERNTEKDYVPVADFASLPGRVAFASDRWSSEIYRKGRGPGEAPTVLNMYHLSTSDTADYDLVYRAWRMPECKIEQTECSFLMRVLVTDYDAIAGSEKDRAAQAAKIAALLFNIDSPPSFAAVGAASGLPVVSTDPSRDLTQIDDWRDRIDAVLYPGGIGFIIYKMHVDIAPEEEPRNWFPDSFRNARK